MKKYLVNALLLVSIIVSAFIGIITNTVFASDEAMHEQTMYTTVRIINGNTILPSTDVSMANQSRKTDAQGFATFEDIPHGEYQLKTYYNGKTYTNDIQVEGKPITVNITKTNFLTGGAGIYVVGLLLGIALIIVLMLYQKTIMTKTVYTKQRLSGKTIALSALAFILMFAFVITIANYQKVIIAALFSAENPNQSFAAEVATIPQPKNVKVFADDKVATLTWDPITTDNIVGYVVQWGKESIGTYTDMKQTIYPVTQIQPLENGVKYIVKVQAVQGTYTLKPTTSEQGGSDKYATTNGNVSPATITSVTPTNSRVASMRSRLTAFFDDFDLSAGGFDESKWNHAVNACVAVGEDGQFINSQFHAHNMTRSGFCDRGGTVSRPRAIFDITGKTESDPGVIEFDLDGVSQPRDVWYLDIIPQDARKNGIPLDITSHNDLFDADSLDPGRMIRIAQLQNGTSTVNIHYYGATNSPGNIGTGNTFANMKFKTPGYEFMSQVDYPFSASVPNVRRHWRIEYSPAKIKIFIDGVKIADAPVPSLFATIKKYQLHTTLFSYNTGKQYDTVAPTTSMLHWDNFGFNGPSTNLVTHNYLDGGAAGTAPLVGRGTTSAPIPEGNRTTKFPIPDPIGNPAGQARVMFTIQPFGYSYYTWNSSNSITVNGHKYAFADPMLNIQSPVSKDNLSMTNIAHATGIYINPADLIQGMNTVDFNLGSDILNAHIEIDYDKSSAPNFTQPKDIFGNYSNYINPPMRANDSYWFVEQKMGLENTTTPTTTLPPAPQTTPVPSGVSTPTPIPFLPTPTPVIVTPTPSPIPIQTGSKIIIYAAGVPARGVYPTIALNLLQNNTRKTVARFTNVTGNPNNSQFLTYTYTASGKVTANQVRVQFTNDLYSASTNEDRNVRIYKINIDGKDYLSADPSVLSTGTWTASTGCAAGYKQSDWLMCNGYFEYK